MIDDTCLMTLCKHAQLTFVQQMYRINTRRFDTEGFVSVASLCGIVGSPS